MVAGVLVGSLVGLGCGDDGLTPSGSGSGTTTADTTGETPMTPADSSSGESPSTETSAGGTAGSIPRCEMPLPIPKTPDCTAVTGVHEGSIVLGEGQDDMRALAGIREVTGSVRLNRLEVTDLDFMECLQVIGEDLTIFDNDQLTDVDGLRSVTEIGTRFVFTENDAITEFDGLPNITELRDTLLFRDNASLTSISGFQQLEEIDSLLIQNNPALLDIDGLGGLRAVSDNLGVTSNPLLCISSVNCVGEGLEFPKEPDPDWSTTGNDDSC